jgi:hypothetical protein
MRHTLIFIIFIPQISWGQINQDYLIYSKVINTRIDTWKMKKDTIPGIIISDNLTQFDMIDELKSKIEIIYGRDKQIVYWTLNYNDSIMRLFGDSIVKKTIYNLVNKLDVPTNLKSDDFKLSIPVIVVRKKWIEKLFKLNIEKGWSKFYNKYPKSPGYFDFSKVSYCENFAALYMVHRANPLIGNGTLVLLMKRNDNWEILTFLNIWNN